MRHQKNNHKWGKSTEQRMSMFRNLTRDLLKNGKVTTTETKAKRVRPLADHMITLGKKGTLHARRQALAFIPDEDMVEKLFKELAPKYAGRPGGYSRVTKLGARAGDAAPMAVLDLVQ